MKKLFWIGAQPMLWIVHFMDNHMVGLLTVSAVLTGIIAPPVVWFINVHLGTTLFISCSIQIVAAVKLVCVQEEQKERERTVMTTEQWHKALVAARSEIHELKQQLSKSRVDE